jgi:hypothetical protein
MDECSGVAEGTGHAGLVKRHASLAALAADCRRPHESRIPTFHGESLGLLNGQYPLTDTSFN